MLLAWLQRCLDHDAAARLIYDIQNYLSRYVLFNIKYIYRKVDSIVDWIVFFIIQYFNEEAWNDILFMFQDFFFT